MIVVLRSIQRRSRSQKSKRPGARKIGQTRAPGLTRAPVQDRAVDRTGLGMGVRRELFQKERAEAVQLGLSGRRSSPATEANGAASVLKRDQWWSKGGAGLRSMKRAVISRAPSRNGPADSIALLMGAHYGIALMLV